MQRSEQFVIMRRKPTDGYSIFAQLSDGEDEAAAGGGSGSGGASSPIGWPFSTDGGFDAARDDALLRAAAARIESERAPLLRPVRHERYSAHTPAPPPQKRKHRWPLLKQLHRRPLLKRSHGTCAALWPASAVAVLLLLKFWYGRRLRPPPPLSLSLPPLR